MKDFIGKSFIAHIASQNLIALNVKMMKMYMSSKKILKKEYMRMKSKTLYIISGVPGSGKDYFLNQYFGNSSNVKIISRDVIRFSLIENDDEYFSKESLVFSKFCKAIREAFNEYDIVIANATHLNERSRNKLLNSLGKDFLKDKLINCIYMDVPLKVALERNAKREGLSLVPEDAIKRMYESAHRPNYDERYEYDKIYIVNEKGGITLLQKGMKQWQFI